MEIAYEIAQSGPSDNVGLSFLLLAFCAGFALVAGLAFLLDGGDMRPGTGAVMGFASLVSIGCLVGAFFIDEAKPNFLKQEGAQVADELRANYAVQEVQLRDGRGMWLKFADATWRDCERQELRADSPTRRRFIVTCAPASPAAPSTRQS